MIEPFNLARDPEPSVFRASVIVFCGESAWFWLVVLLVRLAVATLTAQWRSAATEITKTSVITTKAINRFLRSDSVVSKLSPIDSNVTSVFYAKL